jgi:SNF2 family DNA or RNA helicase
MRYCDAKKGEYGGLDTKGTSNNEELNARLKEVCDVVTKGQVKQNLPPCRDSMVYLSKTDQCRPPAGTADEMKKAARSGAQALIEARIFEAAGRKRKWLVDYVGTRFAMGHKVLIFTSRRLDTEDLAAAVRAEYPSVTLWAGHGGVSSDDRDLQCEAYMAHPGPCILVGTGDSYGTGSNLQDTDDLIFASLPYTWRQLGQWRWRVTRPGQKRPVEILYVIAEGSYDEVIVDIVLGKVDTIADTMSDDEADSVRNVLSGDFDDEAVLAKLLAKLT